MKSIKITVKGIINVVIIIITILLQHSLIGRVYIFGVKPNLPLVAVIITGIINGSGYGGAAGLVTGLYHDAMTGKVIGVFALFGLYSGVLAGLSSKKNKSENTMIALLITYTISAVYESCVYLFGYVAPVVWDGVGTHAGVIYAFVRIIMPVAALNTLIGLPVFLILKAKKNNDDKDDLDDPQVY